MSAVRNSISSQYDDVTNVGCWQVSPTVFGEYCQ